MSTDTDRSPDNRLDRAALFEELAEDFADHEVAGPVFRRLAHSVREDTNS